MHVFQEREWLVSVSTISNAFVSTFRSQLLAEEQLHFDERLKTHQSTTYLHTKELQQETKNILDNDCFPDGSKYK